MKYLVLVALLFSGCSSRMKPGHCFTSWGYPRLKVIEVGEFSYKAVSNVGDKYAISFDAHIERTDCWNEFK